MAKAFFAAFLALLAGVLWVSLPRGIKRPCPVCQGAGTLPATHPIFEGRGQGKNETWVERRETLCPFCDQGRLSLYDLRLKRGLMLKWMVKEQKLDPKELARRAEAGWGKDGLDELHRKNFYLETKP